MELTMFVIKTKLVNGCSFGQDGEESLTMFQTSMQLRPCVCLLYCFDNLIAIGNRLWLIEPDDNSKYRY